LNLRARLLVRLLALAAVVSGAKAHEPWQVLKDCTELSNASNDGDSFHVRAGGQEYIFRLYFVDAPETDASFPDRVNDQAQYFHLTVPQTLQLGDLAKRFTNEKLARPFTVRTCMQDALGRSQRERFYAFIETADGDLAELLVANGMARVHGSSATPVGLTSPLIEKLKLQRLEREAKVEKVGGWGAASGRMTARLTKQPPKTGVDSFTAFFHPERFSTDVNANVNVNVNLAFGRATPTPGPLPQSAPTSAAASGKLDVNTATSAELLGVPGIGPDKASRIIAARPFKNADDLRRVKGIGEKTFAKIRPFFAPAPGGN
jgi:competence ComEA-like helix-hairpin-helix protein